MRLCTVNDCLHAITVDTVLDAWLAAPASRLVGRRDSCLVQASASGTRTVAIVSVLTLDTSSSLTWRIIHVGTATSNQDQQILTSPASNSGICKVLTCSDTSVCAARYQSAMPDNCIHSPTEMLSEIEKERHDSLSCPNNRRKHLRHLLVLWSKAIIDISPIRHIPVSLTVARVTTHG